MNENFNENNNQEFRPGETPVEQTNVTQQPNVTPQPVNEWQGQQSQQPQPYQGEPYSQQYSQRQPEPNWNPNPNWSSEPTWTPQPPEPPKKKGVGGKGILAIILCCAIVFGSLGYFSSQIFRQTDSGEGEVSLVDKEGDVHAEGDDQTENSDQTGDNAPAKNEDLPLKIAAEEEGALTIAEISAKAADSVVEITTESVQTGNMLQQYIASGAGSGVIITEDGYIITNNHVIDKATSINVTLRNGETYPATVIGLDDQSDVALLKIEATRLTPASIGKSGNLVVGQTVVAIGNPLGQLGGTVTNGIISALDRSITLEGKTMRLMQTNAAINPGNSGGGLFDAQGNLIGLVVAKSAGEDIEGLGFAIPIDDIVKILDDLKDYGYVKGRVSIGVSLVDINSNQMAWMYRVNELGVYIYSLTEGGSAAEAGFQPGDRIVAVEGQEVSTAEEVKAVLQGVSVGDIISIEIIRAEQPMTISLTVGEYIPEGIRKNVNNFS